MADLTRSLFDNVKRPDEVLKLSMTDNIKFAVLISLVEIGRVSNREVVNTVLHLVSDFFFRLCVIRREKKKILIFFFMLFHFSLIFFFPNHYLLII